MTCGQRLRPPVVGMITPSVAGRALVTARCVGMADEVDSIIARFWGYVDRPTEGCWTWRGGTAGRGYGYFALPFRDGAKYRQEGAYAHRLAWELHNGAIPDGMYVCHHCDNPPCARVTPDAQYPNGHLFVGSPADNANDCIAKGRKAPYRYIKQPYCGKGSSHGHKFGPTADPLVVTMATSLARDRVTFEELARVCRVDEGTVRQWIKRERAPRNAFTREALTKFLRSRR